MMSSMSEQSPSNSPSVRFNPVPTKPSSGFQYSLAFATATLLRSMDSKVRSSVLRSRPAPYFSLRRLNHAMAYSVRWAKWSFTRSISPSNDAMRSSALKLSNLEMRLILISVSRVTSSSVTSRNRCLMCGLRPSWMAVRISSHVSHSSMSR